MDAAAEAGAPPGRNPFRSPRFPRWWLASMAAGSGVGIQAVTVPLFVRDRVDDELRAVAIASVLVAQTLPGALLTLLGGTLADRVEHRQILLRAFGLAAIVSCAYVALVGLDVRAIWPVYPLTIIVGSAGAFSSPARQSMLPQLVTRAQLQNAVILGTMGFMATLQFLGPTLAGFLVDLRGLGTAFSVEVVLLALGAALFAGVRTSKPEPSPRSMLTDLREGLQYVRGEPALLGLLCLGTVIGVFFIGPFAVTLPILVPDLFHASDRWVGILWGCFGGGVFAGSLALTFWPIPRRGFAVCWSTLQGGLVLLAYGWSETLWLSAGLLVVWGLGASLFMNYVVALLQEHTEPRMLGRVMSMYSLSFFASTPIGYAQAGLVTSWLGPQPMLLLSGACAASIGVASLLFLRPVRSLR